jgi:Permuted papain-like amidase enzyme, YaeF/YiiX, C92 family
MSSPFSRWIARALALYLAQPVKRDGPSATDDPRSLSALLLYGDVLLTDGNTRVAALVRRITRSAWSHVSMYVGPLEEGPDPRCVVEADVAAGVRAVRLSEFKGQRVLVLRPTGLHDVERRRLADWVVSRIGNEYDLAHAWALGRRLLRLPVATPLPRPPSTMAQSATRFICSSLLAQAFVLVGYPIAPDHSDVTPRDFESAAVFEVVRPA